MENQAVSIGIKFSPVQKSQSWDGMRKMPRKRLNY